MDFNSDVFVFKKKFGQNFILDKNFMASIVEQCNVKNCNVLEIGAGAGTLTFELAKVCKKVVSFEIDFSLKQILDEKLSCFDNVQLVFEDILNVDVVDIEKLFNNEEFYIVANIPYYITSPIIFKFFENSSYLNTMFVMVQKEVGERFCAEFGKREYGIPSVVLQTFADCQIVKYVSKTMFVPPPKVDSCIVKIKFENKQQIGKDRLNKYESFIGICFGMKRKTLINNIVSKISISKENLEKVFQQLDLPLLVRPEQISCDKYVKLFDLLKNFID